MKNPLTPAGIEPATFRFVAQHLYYCATATTVVSKPNRALVSVSLLNAARFIFPTKQYINIPCRCDVITTGIYFLQRLFPRTTLV